ncbi:MAG: GTPase ObgE [Clostridia bacterium]|nr:GTPase ObgE [Clostridia bacterium]
MFVDTAEITVRAGAGGNGSVSFHREKYVPAGGPDGGDGGRGGDIILRADDNMSTLMDFRYKTKYVASDGEPGKGKKCFGKDAPPLVIRLPRGTVVKDKASGTVIADMSAYDEFVLAKGGRGGWGNAHFATPTRQAPRFARAGSKGEELRVQLELKLLADVGLVGFPNVGKSTLLSVISAARPKIANYHFTTLVPNLGIVTVGDMSFTVADIPGLIEGASDGAGLGAEFLRHVDRCRLIIHVVDAAGTEGRDPVEDYEQINSELFLYSEELAGRDMIVAANKTDAIYDPELLERLKSHCADYGVEVFEISAATRQGVDALMERVAAKLAALPPVKVYQSEYVREVKPVGEAREVVITRREDGAFVVEGDRLLKAVAMVDPDDYESLNYMQRVLRDFGVFDKLEEMGVNEGDTVVIYNFEFDYIK